MVNRPTMYALDVIVNMPDGSEKEFDHPPLDRNELADMIDDYVSAEGTSFQFVVVKKIPKDWIIILDPDHEAEVFGPFPDRDKAVEWAMIEFGDKDWVARAIDEPTCDVVPKSDTRSGPSFQKIVDMGIHK